MTKATYPQAARRPVRPRHRDRHRRDRRRPGPGRLLRGRAAERDRQARYQPADRHQRADLLLCHRRATRDRAGHDRPATRCHQRAGHRHRHRHQRLQVPAYPPDPHQRRQRGRRPRPPGRRGHQPRPGPLPQRRHRPPAGRHARRHHSPAAGHRSRPARHADLVGPGGTAGQWFYVTGNLNPDTYASEIDSSVLVGFPAAEKHLGFDGHPSEIYVRTTDTQAAVTRVDKLLSPQANPESLSRSTSPAPRTPSPPAPRPRARSTPCSSASAPSPSWWARSASPTS